MSILYYAGGTPAYPAGRSLPLAVLSRTDNVSQITRAFDALKRKGRKGFIPFITAGDPDLETTRELIVELARAGATVIELGVPFTDPMADGPVIQRASERALRHGFGLDEVLKVVAAARTQTEVPNILFSYF